MPCRIISLRLSLLRQGDARHYPRPQRKYGDRGRACAATVGRRDALFAPRVRLWKYFPDVWRESGTDTPVRIHRRLSPSSSETRLDRSPSSPAQTCSTIQMAHDQASQGPDLQVHCPSPSLPRDVSRFVTPLHYPATHSSLSSLSRRKTVGDCPYQILRR